MSLYRDHPPYPPLSGNMERGSAKMVGLGKVYNIIPVHNTLNEHSALQFPEVCFHILDRDIKLWSLHRTDKSKDLPTATFKANLSYHGAAVNVIRFSPSGELLASGGDNGELLIWRVTQTDGEIPSWKVWKTLRFHLKDVLDLGWSPDGAFLMSGSVDNTSIIWNVEKGTAEQVLADHQHYVQGVTWDPAGKYVASLSGDHTCRIYSLRSPKKRSKAKGTTGKYACQHILCKKDASAAVPATTPTMDGDEALQKQVLPSKQYLFYDENMPSFFSKIMLVARRVFFAHTSRYREAVA